MYAIIKESENHKISHRNTELNLFCTCGNQATSDHQFLTENGTVKQWWCESTLDIIGFTDTVFYNQRSRCHI